MNILRTTSAGVLAAALFFAPAPTHAQDAGQCWLRNATPQEAMDRPSPLGTVAIDLGDQTALLCYSRPSARGRDIMGGLVPFDELWRTGANEASQLHLPFDAQVGGQEVPAGSYSIYTIPGAEEWQFFLSSNYQRWGIPISGEVRDAEVASATRAVSETDGMVEMFTITWESHGEMMGHLVFQWENTRVELPIHHGAMQHR